MPLCRARTYIEREKLKSDENQEEGIGWSRTQYLAFVIAMFQTVLLPVLALMALFFVLAVIVGYI